MRTLLPTAYLPPISYVSVLLRKGAISLEAHEHFVKKSIRNRCEILGPNGRIRLSVPIDHDDRWRKPIHEIALPADDSWKRTHWRSLLSAYAHSPYFEFYEDALHAAFFNDHDTLFELNRCLLDLALSWLKQKPDILITDEFTAYSDSATDLRRAWDRERTDVEETRRYYQVFSDRCGFQHDLSIVDLVFNTGPDAIGHVLS